MPLAPPEDGLYRSWPECEAFIQAHAAREGYAVLPQKKNKPKHATEYSRFHVRCVKSGKYRARGALGTRKRRSAKTDCPFNVTIHIRPEGCYLQVMNPNHNHPPSESPADFPQHRKMIEDHKRFIEAGAIAKKSTREIFTDIQKAYPYHHFKLSDIGNVIQQHRRRAKNNATGVQAILYKLAEREDVHTFTLERDGQLEGAFWVPHWSSHLWMRSTGTPDILLMLTSNIINRPVLPILEMNSVLAAANVVTRPPHTPQASTQNAQSTPAATPDLSSFINTTTFNTTPQSAPPHFPPSTPGHGHAPAPMPPPGHAPAPAPAPIHAPTPAPAPAPAPAPETPQHPGVPNGAAPSRNGLSSTLGAGYAILPDRNDPTLLWLMSAVEKLRQRINCPRPAFVTLTDFQTAEKNVLAEVSKGGVLHRQNHVVFGRVLMDVEDASARHGVSSRRVSRPSRKSNAGENPDNEGDEGENNGDSQEEDDEEGEGEEEEDDDDDMEDEDNDPDAEIARQLGGGSSSNSNGFTAYGQNQQQQQQGSTNADGRHPLSTITTAMQAHSALMGGRAGQPGF